MTVRDVVFPAGRQALYERNRYSPAVRSDGLLFVSGQVGSRDDGSPEPELETQVRRAFDNLTGRTIQVFIERSPDRERAAHRRDALGGGRATRVSFSLRHAVLARGCR